MKFAKMALAMALLISLGSAIFQFGCGDDDSAADGDSDGDSDADTDTDTDTDTDADTDADTCPGNSAWYLQNAVAGIASEVAQKEANDFGLYDMLGNVIEWVSDCYHETYDGAPTDGSIWDEDSCEYRIQRGGCFGGPASSLRVSKRDSATPTAYGTCTPGVRCARDADAEPIMDQVQDLVWIEIPGGSFDMGCSDGDEECLSNESPVHEVTIPTFYMMETEATGLDYFNVTGLSPNVDAECPQCAANKVLFANAVSFCESVGGRLPTEAEWEYAARAGTTGRFYCEE